MSRVEGRTLSDTTRSDVALGVRSLLDASDDFPRADAPLLVLPDVTYPFHPSTGMVTNPTVVRTLVDAVRRDRPDADVGVAFAGSDAADGETAAELLGYDRWIGDRDVDVVDLTDARAVERTVEVGDETRTVNVPEPLLDRQVVAVPTLRYGRDRPLVGGTAAVARAVRASTVPGQIAAASLAVDPALTLLDGTYAFTGRPSRPRFLLSSSDVFAIDRLTSRLLGREPAAVPSLAATGVQSRGIDVSGVSLEALRRRLSVEPPPDSSTPSRLVQAGYRFYTTVTGDAYPPQFER